MESSRKKSTIINCWKKAGIINFRFSLTEKETDEHTTLSNIDEIKKKTDFISMYEIIKSSDKYKSIFDLTKTAEEQEF